MLLFRGEKAKYDSVLPSVYRQASHEHDYFHILVHNLAQHLLDDILAPHLESSEFGPIYKGEWIGGDLQEAEEFMAYPQFSWVLWQLEALFQHYGWPTSCVDVTFDPKVAAFFACLDFRSQTLLTQGKGHIYVWSRSRLRSDGVLTFRVPVIALEHMASCIADVFGVRSTRPQTQRAAILRIPYGHAFLDDFIRAQRFSIEFDRHDAADELDEFSHYFPPDPLLKSLDQFEELYVNFCRSLPPHSVGEDWHKFVSFLTAWRASKA